MPKLNDHQRALYDELRSDKCQCGGAKKRHNSFCQDCYFKLTPELRKDIYQPIGDGYETAHAKAMRQLTEWAKV